MVKETSQKSTIKATPITPKFTDARQTNYGGGLVPFSDFFLDKLDFGQALAEHLDLGMGAIRHFQVLKLPEQGPGLETVSRLLLSFAEEFSTALPSNKEILLN